MKKKGFTLIELLAVIVILAIIALIATPLVLKYIEKSRKESKVDSAYSYVRNLESEITNYSIKNNGKKYNKSGLVNIDDFDGIDTTVKGDTPESGKVCLSSLGQVDKAILQYDKYYVLYDGKIGSISDKDTFGKFNCNGANNSNITTEVSDNVMMAFYDLTTFATDPKTFAAWAGDVTKVVFAKEYGSELTIVSDIETAKIYNSYNAIDISAAGDNSVVAYLTTEGEEKILNIAGKDGVVMANENSVGVFAMLPYAKTVEFNDAYNTENATMMAMMFGNDVADGAGISSWESLDLSTFNTSNVTIMSGMFFYCAKLTELDLSSFDTSNVTDMSSMFQLCLFLKTLNVSSFNTSNVTNMAGMFKECYSIEALDLSSFDTSNVTDMHQMFSHCTKLPELDLSSFNTSNVTDMSSMFSNCSSLKTLNLSSFNTSKVTDMSSMFGNCESLEIHDLSHFDTSNVTNMWGMFYGCKSLNTLDLSSFNTSKVTQMNNMFISCLGLEHIYVGDGWDTTNASTTSMFLGCRTKAVEYKTA